AAARASTSPTCRSARLAFVALSPRRRSSSVTNTISRIAVTILTEEILTEPLDYADFSLGVPTGPGLGIALDEDKFARFRRDRTAPTLHVVGGKGAKSCSPWSRWTSVSRGASTRKKPTASKRAKRSVSIWRVVGRYANVSIFDVESNSELNDILTNLPLYPFMEMKVTPVCRHPSSLDDDDR